MMRDLFSFGSVILCCLFASPAFAQVSESKQERAAPAFKQLIVRFESDDLNPFNQTEVLRIESDGTCWYSAEARNGRPGAALKHGLSSARIERLNRLLKETDWLTAAGAEGPATHTDATTVTIDLVRDDGKRKAVCHGRRPAPYAALLHELTGLALQERRIYLHDYVGGEEAARVWMEIGNEVAAMRGDAFARSPFDINYRSYLPIARRIMRRFYDRRDEELIPALLLVGHFRDKSELKYLHRLAHDRSSRVRREVAWTLGRIHDDDSLPVLASMMSQGGDTDFGFELIQWGDKAVPDIVRLIAQSTDDRLDSSENTIGEQMIRAYLDNWDKLSKPVDTRVVAAVRDALNQKDPANGRIRTTYHQEFLKQVAKAEDKAAGASP